MIQPRYFVEKMIIGIMNLFQLKFYVQSKANLRSCHDVCRNLGSGGAKGSETWGSDVRCDAPGGGWRCDAATLPGASDAVML